MDTDNATSEDRARPWWDRLLMPALPGEPRPLWDRLLMGVWIVALLVVFDLEPSVPGEVFRWVSVAFFLASLVWMGRARLSKRANRPQKAPRGL